MVIKLAPKEMPLFKHGHLLRQNMTLIVPNDTVISSAVIVTVPPDDGQKIQTRLPKAYLDKVKKMEKEEAEKNPNLASAILARLDVNKNDKMDEVLSRMKQMEDKIDSLQNENDELKTIIEDGTTKSSA